MAKKNIKKEMLINYVPGEECRIAIVEDDVLEEFYQERASSESHVSNIYKGRVTNIEPSIQAAFVDFGLERNGFLHISDLHPMYFPGKDREEFEKVGSKTPRRDRPPIQRCLKRGQEVLVQVLKEGIGTKGPTVTSYLSIPGRFLVMMPNMQRLGVSRKVEDDEQRRQMRDVLKDLDPPEGFGFIIRTAGMGQTKTELKRDLAYLTRLWKSIERKQKRVGRVGELYAESDLVIRTIRDVFTTDIERVVVDHAGAARRAHDFLNIANPRTKSKVLYYDDPIPLFHRLGIERQIDTINAREVPLKSGGALVVDQTEALVAIDVNSGKSRDARDAETNAYRTNQEAVDEICRQLRLRDLGGLVVLDLIDMYQAKHRRSIEQQMRNNLKRDRARSKIGPISQFGLMEMTRQRMRPSLRKSIYAECHHCAGRGYTMSVESVVLTVMRRLAVAMHRDDVARIELTISPDVAFQLLNRKRAELASMEARHNVPVLVRVGGQTLDHIDIVAYNDRGGAHPAMPEGDGKAVDPSKDSAFRDVADLDDDFGRQPGDEVPGDDDETSDDSDQDQPAPGKAEDDAEAKPKRRRRRGGRGRSRKSDAQDSGDPPKEQPQPDSSEARQQDSGKPDGEDDGSGSGGKRRRRRRRRRKSDSGSEDHGDSAQNADKPDDKPADNDKPQDDAKDSKPAAQDSNSDEGGKKKRRRRRGKRGGGSRNQGNDQSDTGSDAGSGSGSGSGSDKPPKPEPAVVSSGYGNTVIKDPA